MLQRTFNFDQAPAPQPQASQIAEATSLPPPVSGRPPVPLVRPDRQITYGGAIHFDWPAPDHDRDTITVDRIRDDIDGPSHRFVIKRGDVVEVFLSPDRVDIGEVTGISHRNNEVQIHFLGATNGVWFSTGCIYPTLDEMPSSVINGVSLSKLVAEVGSQPEGGFTAADQVTPSPKELRTLQARLLKVLEDCSPKGMTDWELRGELGYPEFDPEAPLTNPVYGLLATLRDAGKIHVVMPRWGAPIFSVLKWPPKGELFTLHDCPDTLTGPEVKHLMKQHRLDVPELAARLDFTQQHVKEVLGRGLSERGAVLDWMEAMRKEKSPSPTECAVPTPTLQDPFSFDEYRSFRTSLTSGHLSFEQYQDNFARLLAAKESITEELTSRFNAKELRALAARMGDWNAGRSTKDQNALAIYQQMLGSFVLDGVVSYSMGERYEDAVSQKVQRVTREELAAAFAKRAEASEAHQKALADPQTFFEFRTFLQHKRERDLTDEQLARYDALHADSTRDRRASQVATTVQQFQNDQISQCEFQTKEGYHEKRQCPVWIVSLRSRVERAAFDELNRKAKMMGGWYSSFKKSEAGFHFLTDAQAQTFTELLSGDVDRTDVLNRRKAWKEQTAAERLHELATELAERADEVVERSNGSLQNTARRADIQAGVRGRAYADHALARTLHSIAESLSRGESKYLDGIRHKTHVETLDTVLYLAKWARVRAVERNPDESAFSHGRRRDQAEEIPVGPDDIRYTEYPYPTIYRRHLEELVLRCQSLKGVKQVALKMGKHLMRNNDEFVTYQSEHEIEVLENLLSRARVVDSSVERIEQSLEKYRRLQRAGITDIHELRAALREYLNHRASVRGDDPVKTAERELIGRRLPGFFPTPPSIIRRILELAEIESNHSVLEPSCGKGDIIDAVKTRHPEASLHAIERNLSLSDVLSAKGHEVEFSDFLDHRGQYDRIVMNPPFENGADMEHIQHAYSLLKPGGRLVAVSSEGPFFREDRKSKAFRQWLDKVEAEVEQLPEGAFQGVEAFRETAVRTRLITIDKEAYE